MSHLTLTVEEKSLLDGVEGPGVQRAMEIVVALGRIYGAADLVPVKHVQISGVSYKNLGDAGVEFLSEWAGDGAKVRVPTTLNPAGMELERWQAMGFSPDFAKPQLSAIAAFVRMGVRPTMSCTPYLFPDIAPQRGDPLAWAESSAVVWANSVVGASTNREGGPSALAAAIVGRTARYGYHLEENRRATHVVEVRCALESTADFGALSYIVGRAVGNGVPYFPDLCTWLPPKPEDITLKGFDRVISRLKKKMKFNKIHHTFLRIMHNIGGHIAQHKANAHKDSIALLRWVFQLYEQLVQNPDMPPAERKQMVESSIQAY